MHTATLSHWPNQATRERDKRKGAQFTCECATAGAAAVEVGRVVVFVVAAVTETRTQNGRNFQINMHEQRGPRWRWPRVIAFITVTSETKVHSRNKIRKVHLTQGFIIFTSTNGLLSPWNCAFQQTKYCELRSKTVSPCRKKTISSRLERKTLPT